MNNIMKNDLILILDSIQRRMTKENFGTDTNVVRIMASFWLGSHRVLVGAKELTVQCNNQ